MARKDDNQLSIFSGSHDPKGSLTVLSYGGGQNSAALLHLYRNDPDFRARHAPGRFLVVMSDTGDEHPETLNSVADVKQICEREGIEFHFLSFDRGFHSEKWPSLRAFYKRTRTIGSKMFPAKACTDQLKIKPIYRFLDSWLNEQLGTRYKNRQAFYDWRERNGPIRMLIGIAAGEERRMAKNGPKEKYRRDNVVIEYPLVDLGLDRQGCQDYIRSVGESVPYPSHCLLCHYATPAQLVWLDRFRPDDVDDWIAMEEAKLEKFSHKGEKNYGVFGAKRLPEALKKAREQYGHLSDKELDELKFHHGHCVLSAY